MSSQNSDLRIVFAGTPDFAASHLQALIQAGCNIVSAYSQPDRPSGRGKKISATAVKAVAETAGIPVFQPLSLTDTGVLEQLRSHQADVIVVVAYGLLLPPAVLALPRYGCINVHASLLPRWRGAAPIERAILAGDERTGICIMQMDAGLDTGPVLASQSTAISPTDNSQSLTLRLITLGCDSLLQVLDQLPTGTLQAAAQSAHGISYATKLRKEDSLIPWQDSALKIDARIRALFPRSPAFTFYQGQRIRIFRATVVPGAENHPVAGTVLDVSGRAVRVSTGAGELDILELQLEGKSPVSVASLLNGHPHYFKVGTRFLEAAVHE